MMTNKGDNERRIQCPYDPSHQILHYRFQTHLVKCKRNFPNVKMVDCMYNSVHQIPEPEIAYHHEHCVDRIGLDKFVYVPETVDANKFPIPQVNLKSEEDWDDEYHEPYNPEEYCKNNPILRNQNTLSAAKRRHFRMEERQRMQQFANGSTSQNAQPTIPVPAQPERQPERNPRRPMARSAGLLNHTAPTSDPATIAKLMEQVKLGANTATVPKRVGALDKAEVKDTSSNANGNSQTEDSSKFDDDSQIDEAAGYTFTSGSDQFNSNDNDYPPLGSQRGRYRQNNEPPSGTWTAASLAREWGGMAVSNNKPVARGIGRGSTLAQQRK